MADEEIIVKYTVEAEDAVAKAEKFREVVETSKEAIRRVVAEGKVGFQDLGRSMIEAFKNFNFSEKLDQIKLGGLVQIDPESLQQESAFYEAQKLVIDATKKAVTELGQEERAQARESAKVVQERLAAEKDLTQQSVQWKKQASEAELQTQKELDAVAKKRNADEIALVQEETKWKQQLAKASADAEKELAQAAKERNAEELKLVQEEVAWKKQLQETEKIRNQELNQSAKERDQAERDLVAKEQAWQKQLQATKRAIAAEDKAAKQAEISAMREYEKSSKDSWRVMSDAAKAYGQQVEQVKQQIVTQANSSGQTYQQVAQSMQQAGTSANVLNSALKQLNQQSNQTGSSFGSLGSIIKQAFVVGLGINLYNVLRQLITFLQEATKAGYDLTKAFFQLEVGIRAIRRAGVDIATSEMLDNLDKLREKFGTFSKKELVEGSAAFVNLIRDMGLTKDQIFELQDAVATLAVVNGRSMDEVQKTVALALSSGYTEGLQRLGVSINRVTIAARASAMGFADGYNALSEYERAAATLSLVLEKTAKYSDDLAKYQETQVGQIDTLLAKQKDQTAEMGQKLLPIQLEYNKALVVFYDSLNDLLGTITPFISALVELQAVFEKFNDVINSANISVGKFYDRLVPAGSAVRDVLDKVSAAVTIAINPMKGLSMMVDSIKESFVNLKKAIPDTWQSMDWLTGPTERILGMDTQVFDTEVPVGEPTLNEEALKDSGKEIKDYVSELYADIEKETRRFNSRMAELERDLGRDLAKIERELGRDLAEATREYQRDREKIIEDGERKVQKAIEDYNRKVVDEQRKYSNKVAEAEAKYREDQLQAEIDYQEDLRKLREGFLFDLEDALRERDARQVLNLVRRYNLEKDQAGRQFEIQNEERARQHALQMEEMAREYAERMQLMAEEQAARIAQIREDTRLELEERRMAYEQEKQDRIQKAADDIEERKIRQQELIAELKIEHDERLAEIVAALADEAGMTSEMLEGIGNEYRRIYGPNGVIDQQLNYYIAKLASLSQLKAAAMANSASIDISRYNDKTIVGNGGGAIPNAEGGIIYADRPTTVTFGETGMLEKAEFTPIGYRGMNTGKVTHSLVSPNNTGGRIVVAVELSPDLEARITENTLDQAAEVMFEVQRRR